MKKPKPDKVNLQFHYRRLANLKRHRHDTTKSEAEAVNEGKADTKTDGRLEENVYPSTQ